MAKGFMIFVDGLNAPQKVHNSINSAWREMSRLAEINPDREILILQVSKRMKWNAEAGKPESIGSHFPPDAHTNLVDKSQLVRRRDLLKSDKKTA